MTARPLMETLVATIGVETSLKDADARHAVALMRKLGTCEQIESDDARSLDLGREFLQAAEVIDVDMSDQSARWRAFGYLKQLNPAAARLGGPSSIAQECVVLRDADGTRYVRSGWFSDFAKASDPNTHTAPGSRS